MPEQPVHNKTSAAKTLTLTSTSTTTRKEILQSDTSKDINEHQHIDLTVAQPIFLRNKFRTIRIEPIKRKRNR